MWLHNKCRNINAEWLEKLVIPAGLAQSLSAVQKEPTAILARFPVTITGIKGIDVMITGTPQLAASPTDQQWVSHQNHMKKEVMKWRGTSWPNAVHLGMESVKIMIKGHVVVEDLIANNVKLLPATIDPFIAEGPAVIWF
eukprot:5380640-Ditylum_brightwellii.AAC.1